MEYRCVWKDIWYIAWLPWHWWEWRGSDVVSSVLDNVGFHSEINTVNTQTDTHHHIQTDRQTLAANNYSLHNFISMLTLFT